MAAEREPWIPGPLQPQLAVDSVHVWCVALDAYPEETITTLVHLLSPEEKERADRFHFLKDRNAFTIARALLRILLARYLAQPAQQLRFHYNQNGKPALVEHSLSFNVAHSGDLALYAVAQSQDIGVDVEYMRAGVEYESLARHFFSPREVAWLLELPVEQRRAAFFACWTRKEAYIKARGLGLSLDLTLFDVALQPQQPVALLETREEGQSASDWSLYSFTPPRQDYAGALIVRGSNHRLAYYLESPYASGHYKRENR